MPNWDPISNCLFFPEEFGKAYDAHSPEVKERFKKFCGRRRMHHYIGTGTVEQEKVLFFPMDARRGYRFLGHFYAFLFSASGEMDRHLKRFIRDLMHYQDEIFCAASRIIKMIRAESKAADKLFVWEGRGSMEVPNLFCSPPLRKKQL